MKRTLLLAVAVVLFATAAASAQDAAAVMKAEANRVAVVQKVKPSVVAVFARGGQGGGTGVVISEDGYALTNFHVVQPTGPTPQCGLPDGVLYDAVLVGLDRVGDVALIKLLPKKAGQKFPYAVLGDSDKVREGDWSIAMGNPFLLATDFTPTVTFGLVSGVNRYQYPAGILLEYTDCIQIDTSINPGNSGGPLFNMSGELIGINGRGSFDKRGRINSGVGYAISINQIKNFMGQLKAGIDTDHASLGATVGTETEKTGLGKMRVRQILEDSDVSRRGVDLDDEIVSFAGRQMMSTNQFKNVLGIYPRGWRMPMEYRRDNKKKEVLVRLMGVQRKELPDDAVPKDDPDDPLPKKKPKDDPTPKLPIQKMPNVGPTGPGAKFYEAKEGYANYYFNRQMRERLLADFAKQGDFKSLTGPWTIEGVVRLKKLRSENPIKLELLEEKEGKGSQPLVKFQVESFPYQLYPLKFQDPSVLKTPDSSGGLLAAMFLWQRLLTLGEKGFSDVTHGGVEPIYPPPADGSAVKSIGDLRTDAEVLLTRNGPFLTRFYFAPTDHKLLAMEVRLKENEDPCEIYFGDYRPDNGRLLPHKMSVIYGELHYGTFTLTKFDLAK
jgi:S1-C subfamily serine protease